jgi:hypothetical protein
VPVSFPLGYDTRGKLTLEEAQRLLDQTVPAFSQPVGGADTVRIDQLEVIVLELQATLDAVISDNNTLKSRLREAGLMER